MPTIYKTIKLIYKDQAWFDENATLVLKAGQTIYLAEPDTNTPTAPKFKRGDSVNQLQNLVFNDSGGGSGVQSVTGPPVDNTDPENPVVNAPTQASFDALNSYVLDILAGQVSGHIANTANPHNTTKAQVGLGNVDNTADIDKPVSTAQAAAIASAVAGLMDYRGVFDASVNAYPSSGGSGTAGAILKSDFWIVSVAGTLPTGLVVEAGDLVIAKIDTPGNTQANWSIIQYNIGYTPENAANKAATLVASSTQYPNNDAVIAALLLKSNLIALVGSTAAARGDNVTQYHGKLLGASPATTATNRRFQFMRAGTITHILYQISATNVPSNEAVPLSLRQNNTTDHFLTNIDWSVIAANVPSAILIPLATPVTVNTTDYYELKEATPVMGTNPVSATLIVEFLTL